MTRPHVALLGLSHRTAGLAVRERLAIPAGRVKDLYGALKASFPSAEGLLLGTCNRVELYVAADPLPEKSGLLDFLASFQGVEASALAPHAYGLEGSDAVRHCFSVASGLEALALGETQVLGQAKEAYGLAQEHGMLEPVLHALFQQAFATAKRGAFRAWAEASLGGIVCASCDASSRTSRSASWSSAPARWASGRTRLAGAGGKLLVANHLQEGRGQPGTGQEGLRLKICTGPGPGRHRRLLRFRDASPHPAQCWRRRSIAASLFPDRLPCPQHPSQVRTWRTSAPRPRRPGRWHEPEGPFRAGGLPGHRVENGWRAS